MELSIFLAKMLAIYFVVAGIGIMFNTKRISHMVDGFRKNAGLSYSIGAFTLLLGAAFVIAHNIWSGWETIITIIAWITLIKGILFFLIPGPYMKFAKTVVKAGGAYFVLSILTVVLGLVLGYFGFLA